MSSFYQKYRPRKWPELVGQETTIEILRSQIKKQRYHHAYLMYGPSGSGKTSSARLLAMAMNCQNGTHRRGEPCGRCQSCDSCLSGSHWDVLEIDGARCRGIEEAKQLAYKAHLSPLSGGKKVYIIDEAHALTSDAFNVLLKLLEEPPPNVALILCTTQFEKIPDTVRSRCQLYRFQPLGAGDIRQKLEMICKRERIKADQKHLDWIAETAAGNMRAGENMLEQISVLSKRR